MRVLLDITHPAHAHFFRNPLRLLRERGHDIVVTSRTKDCAVPLLDAMGIEHHMLLDDAAAGTSSLPLELLRRDRALWRFTGENRPDVMAAIGGTFIAHVGALRRIRSVVFYDTENARLQNAITYPLASLVVVPRAYRSWVPKKHLRYAGYHELSYLHPDYFVPDRERAVAAGLDRERENFLLRVVAWQASHDIGETGWTPRLLEQVIDTLGNLGAKVIVSSETDLPSNLRAYRYQGDPDALHHLMAHCRMYIGESATMASECAVLGVPALYVAETGRGYTTEQDLRYGLVRHIPDLNWDSIRPVLDEFLSHDRDHWSVARKALLEDCTDVADMATRVITSEDTAPASA